MWKIKKKNPPNSKWLNKVDNATIFRPFLSDKLYSNFRLSWGIIIGFWLAEDITFSMSVSAAWVPPVEGRDLISRNTRSAADQSPVCNVINVCAPALAS